jgi:hypothetical protein
VEDKFHLVMCLPHTLKQLCHHFPMATYMLIQPCNSIRKGLYFSKASYPFGTSIYILRYVFVSLFRCDHTSPLSLKLWGHVLCFWYYWKALNEVMCMFVFYNFFDQRKQKLLNLK